ncbi:LysR family transcriptional regulator [Acidovorax sp. NCPPB 4044]|uniref:LysR family transcriptional regulator n=1 Tax=Acidovorax sp. NCPPB 4044 TaxID=2940490 RepID=UPI002303342B|nr:LysR family transcriptional regulator [Acidovorax sp. NCPPB 4044]MDA8520157.1 LysR family transcriptional regulator [Acidovorax sp. NCPPB 4044]
MTSFRELEALVAVVDMGSFEAAARGLNTSQSAVSRLIRDFESGFSVPLLDRDRRAARLTATGWEVLRVARAILRQRNTLLEHFCSADLLSLVLRVGVTELAASTWLPSFVGRLRERYPRAHLEVEVASSPSLVERVRTGQLSLAIVIDVMRTTEMVRSPIGIARTGWFCAPGLMSSDTLTLHDLERHTLLLQGATTGAGRLLSAWLAERSIEPANVIQTDSLSALSGIAAAGLGIAHLPRSVASDALQRGRLKEVCLPVASPDLNYVAIARIETISSFHRAVIEVAQGSCDFNTPFHLLSPQLPGEGR